MCNENLSKELDLIKHISESLSSINDINLLGGSSATTLCGIPALIILLGELSKVDDKFQWDVYSLKYIKMVNNLLANKPLNTSVFYGLSGFGYSLLANNKNGQRYSNLLSSTNKAIIYIVNKYIEQSKPSMESCECIQGLSGIGRYLLFFSENKEILGVIEKILRYVISLTDEIIIDGNRVPGWYMSTKNSTSYRKDIYPNGYFDYGVAHGITGCLSFLSISLINGVEVKGQKEAIGRILDFIYMLRGEKKGVIYFDGDISLEDYLASKGKGKDKEEDKRKNNLSWCYGTAGISRGIFLAGKALNNKFYIKDATEIILTTLATINENIFNDNTFSSPTFCHGYSGYMNILNLFYKDTKEEQLKTVINKLKHKIISFYDKDNIFGFSDYDLDHRDMRTIIKTDSIGIMTGTSSVLLPLLGEK